MTGGRAVLLALRSARRRSPTMREPRPQARSFDAAAAELAGIGAAASV
jgi:hypothetical protein